MPVSKGSCVSSLVLVVAPVLVITGTWHWAGFRGIGNMCIDPGTGMHGNIN